nr:thiamine pyrophosphate-dependent enzyme [Gordonibacter massiliensis (ex Traore et al. 2017)]
MIAGNGVRSAGAQGLLTEFARKTDIPVLTSMNAVDLVQDDLKIGFIGTHGNRVANMIVSECDLIISIGARLGLRQVGRDSETFAPNASIVRADIDEYELARSVRDDEEKYLVDAKDFLVRLLAEDIPNYSEWKQKCLAAKDALAGYDNEIGNRAIGKISDLLPKNPVVAVDVGQHECWSAQSLHLKGDEGRILIAGGYGSMGCGLPFAIGASISRGGDTAFCITGDGGLQMNIQELETVVRERLPVKILVINNKVLGKISETQHANHEDRFAQTTAESGYTVPDFEKVANAYGIKAATLPSYEELDKYAGWLCDDEPCLLNIMLPENTLLVPKVDWKAGVMKPLMDEGLVENVRRVLA